MTRRQTLETGIRAEGFELVLRREQALRESQRQSYEATISSLRKELRALQGQVHALDRPQLSDAGLTERLLEVVAGTKLAEAIAAPLFDRALDARDAAEEGTELEGFDAMLADKLRDAFARAKGTGLVPADADIDEMSEQ